MTVSGELYGRSPIVLHAVLRVGPAHLAGDSWTPRKWATLRDWFENVLPTVLGNDGAVVAWGQDHVQVLFEHDTGAAVETAIALHEAAFEMRATHQLPVELALAVTRGEVELLRWGPESEKTAQRHVPFGIIGDAVVRASALADIAVAGALLIDTSVLQDLSLEYISSRVGLDRDWRGTDYLGPVRESRLDPREIPIAYYEFKWSGDELMGDQGRRAGATAPGRHLGVLSRWNGANAASLQAEDGEILWTDRDSIVGGVDVLAGTRVSFTAQAAAEKGGARLARAVLAVGTQVEGTVLKVFEDRRYAFVLVEDAHGTEREVFLHADDNEWPIAVGDRLRFTVGENVRGAVALKGVVLRP